MMSRQDRSAVAALETIGLLRRVRTVAVQQTPVRNCRTTPTMRWLPVEHLDFGGRSDRPFLCLPDRGRLNRFLAGTAAPYRMGRALLL